MISTDSIIHYNTDSIELAIQRINNSLEAIKKDFPDFGYEQATSFDDLYYVKVRIATLYGLNHNLYNIRRFANDNDKRSDITDKIKYKHYKSFRDVVYDPNIVDKGMVSTFGMSSPHQKDNNEIVGLSSNTYIDEKVIKTNEIIVSVLAPNPNLGIKDITPKVITKCINIAIGIENKVYDLQENALKLDKARRTPNFNFHQFYDKL